MKIYSTLRCLGVALASFAAVGCVGTADEDIASVQDDLTIDNGLTTNGLTTNGLTTNGLTTNGLTTNGLTTNGLTTNGLTTNGLTANVLVMSALSDPNARELLKYIVSCALATNESVTFTVDAETYTFPGEIGLAPGWGEPGGNCEDAYCQGWVSACVLARVDYLGATVPISIRGASPFLQTTAAERATYTEREATYYGNIFSSPMLRYACLSPGQTSDTRVCGPSLAGCVMQITGQCDVECGHVRADGSFPKCRNVPPGWPGSTVYPGSVTVFLKP
jgi:hypothetical protein